MKFLCEGCDQLVTPSDFTLERGAVVLVCEKCGAKSSAQRAAEESPLASPSPAPALRVIPLRAAGGRRAEEAAEPPDPFALPPGHCPKCIAARPEGALTCTHCGLVYDNFRPREHRPSGPLGAAWLSLLERWDDRAAHDRFLALAAARQELPSAGRLYWIRLAAAPGNAEAQRGREEVLRLAAASSVLIPAVASESPHRFKRALALLILVATSSVAAWVLFRL